MKYFKDSDSPLRNSEIEATDYDSKYKAKTACIIDIAVNPENEMGMVFKWNKSALDQMDANTDFAKNVIQTMKEHIGDLEAEYLDVKA